MNKVIHKKSTSTINAKGVMKRHFKSALALFMPLFVLSCLTISSALILSSSGSTAIETEAITTTVKVLEACSMTANPDSTDTAHSVEMIGGTVENSIGVTTIDVTCNDRDGYSVYAVGYGNNTVGNTDLTGAATGQTIPTGTNMTTSVSNWAMRLTAVDNSTNYFVPTILSDANGSFAANHAVPSNNTKVVTFQNAIDVSKPSRFTTTYAAAVTPYQAADTYTGQVKYTLVHPNYTNADGTTESYAGPLTFTNASSMTIDGVTYTSSSEAPNLTHGEHTISAGTFPTGYEFGSWSATGGISITDPTSATTTINVISAGTLSLNGKPRTFTVTIATNNATSVNIDGATYSSGAAPSLAYGTHTVSGTYPANYEFDSWSSTGSISVSSTSTASTTMTVSGAGTLTLNAKQSCTITTLPTGTGWMQTWSKPSDLTQYCDGASVTLKDNRDNEQYLVAKLADGKIWMLDNLRLGGTSTISLTTADSNTNGNYTLPASGSWSDSYSVAYINSASKNNTTTGYGSGSKKIGVYYNYCAASAGTYCYASGSGTGNASYDICPKGWRMPTGGDTGEYQALYEAYSSNATNFRAALSTPLAGYFNSSSANLQGSNGYFWSSTYYYGNYMYILYVSSSNVYPTSNSNRGNGLSVRCILK